MKKDKHWIAHLAGAPDNVTLHHWTEYGLGQMSGIYEGEIPAITMERCGEGMMIAHYRKYVLYGKDRSEE